MPRWLALILVLVLAPGALAQAETTEPPAADAGASPYSYYWDPATLTLLRGSFVWTIGNPILSPGADIDDTSVSVRQPTTLWFQQKWHTFIVSRAAGGKHQIEYAVTGKLEDLQRAKRAALKLGDLSVSAPQVFYFEPQKRWYLIFQTFDPTAKRGTPAVRPMYATSDDVTNPAAWSTPTPLEIPFPQFDALWRDFWVVCDEEDAFLFYTTPDGRVFRCRTTLEEFPRGFNPPLAALKGDFISSAHVYRVKKLRRYLMLVEAQDLGRRYAKVYINTRLDAGWDALATTLTKPLAGAANVTRAGNAPQWTDSIAEAQLLREGIDQTQTVDPKNLRLLFSGCMEADRAGRGAGEIPWKIGTLEHVGLLQQFRNNEPGTTSR